MASPATSPAPPATATPTMVFTKLEYIGRVVDDETEDPIRGAEVMLEFQGAPPIVYTDSKGIYRFPISFSGDRLPGRVRVSAKDYQKYDRFIELRRDNTGIEDIRLSPLTPSPTVAAVVPSDTPTPTPTDTPIPPTPTRTPQTRPVEIAALNIRSEVQEDGTIKNIAQLSIKPLGVGELKLTTPARIKLGDSGIVRLIITPDSALTSLPQVALASLSIDSPGLAGEPDYVLRFSDRIQIYPVMVAELRGANFDIVSDDQPAKPVVWSLPVEWIWLVTPKVGGEQTLVLSISIPVLIDQTREIISAQPLKNIPIKILVEVTPTPTPSHTPSPTLTPTPTPTSTPTSTPTPLPIAQRIGDQLISNSAIILTALIGLLGTFFTGYIAIQNSKRQTKIEDLKRRIELAKSEKELEALERKITHLKSIGWWQFWRR